MGIFNMFNKEDKVAKKDYSIFDEFSIDIRNLNKEDFIDLDEEINSAGSKIVRYSYSLPLKELELFDSLEFIEFESGERNVFFKAFIQNMDATPLINLINRLHLAYGKDLLGNEKFEDSEINSIQRLIWTGRLWDKAKPSITISQETVFIQLGVLGINVQSTSSAFSDNTKG